MSASQVVLVTGATGYIGGRLVPQLLESGYRVRCLVRDARRLQGRTWSDQVEVREGDALHPESLSAAMKDVWAAYYLIRSLTRTKADGERDLLVARNFGQAAQEAGMARIIYLRDLDNPDAGGSALLRSRQETGEALAQGDVPVTEFRAAIVVGSGSLAFEMLHYLTERWPVMICPRWTNTCVQPIGISDVLRYLVGALRVPESAGRIIEIGGPDRLTFGDMIRGYAKVRGLRRVLIPLPLGLWRLSAYSVHWMAPMPARMAYPLIEGLGSEVVVRDDTAQILFHDIKPVGYETSIQQALTALDEGQVETSWSDALASSLGDVRPVELSAKEGLYTERRQKVVEAPPQRVFTVFNRVRSDEGWLYAHWLWWLRGVVDRLMGGPGFRRGRRDPDRLRVGDTLDFFRVEAVEPDHLLRLRSEMKMPGRAWLQLEARPQENGRTLLVQTAFMAPEGLSGHLYWYGLYPVHRVIFSGMISEIADRAEAMAST